MGLLKIIAGRVGSHENENSTMRRILLGAFYSKLAAMTFSFQLSHLGLLWKISYYWDTGLSSAASDTFEDLI